MTKLILAVLALSAVALVLGFMGALHVAGDSFAVLRMPLAIWVLILALAMRRTRWMALPAGALALVALIGWIPHKIGGTAKGATVRLYQKNLLFTNATRDAVIADIRATAPDVITLQEVSPHNTYILTKLANTWPTQAKCQFAAVGGVAVLSKWPMVEGSKICQPGDGLVAIQVLTDRGPLWVVSIHLHWPWPFRQAPQVDRLMPVLGALHGPRVIAGDFNMVPWSHTMARVRRASGTRRLSHVGPTFHTTPLPVPLTIDHVLAGSGAVTTRPGHGSDHLGLLADVVPSDG